MAKKKTIKKPKLHKTEYYYWNDITAFIKAKYGKEVRDWAGRWKPKHNPDAPYQDFWHSILNRWMIVDGNDQTREVYWSEYDNVAHHLESWEKEIIDILIKEGFDGVEINFSW